MAFYRIPWRRYEETIASNVGGGIATAILILLIIGALGSAWMVSGVVPALICYGMQIIHPDFFLTCTCVICALVPSVITLFLSTLLTGLFACVFQPGLLQEISFGPPPYNCFLNSVGDTPVFWRNSRAKWLG